MTTINTAMAFTESEEHAIAVAKQALASELAIDTRRISVGAISAMQWSDGSLGCPEPGMSYTQALVSGYRVMLTLASATYEMHVAGNHAVHCKSNKGQKSVDIESTRAGVRMAELARQDLAARLGVDQDKVVIESVRPVRWPDPAIQCEDSKKAFASVAPGFVIRLIGNGKPFSYHADHVDIVYCGPQSPAADD